MDKISLWDVPLNAVDKDIRLELIQDMETKALKHAIEDRFNGVLPAP